MTAGMCVSHHFACDCREAAQRDLVASLRAHLAACEQNRAEHQEVLTALVRLPLGVETYDELPAAVAFLRSQLSEARARLDAIEAETADLTFLPHEARAPVALALCSLEEKRLAAVAESSALREERDALRRALEAWERLPMYDSPEPGSWIVDQRELAPVEAMTSAALASGKSEGER
jgi:hypothetical protein